MADAKVLVEFEVDAAGAIKQVRQFKKATGEIPAATDGARRSLINLKTVLAGLGAYFSIRSITQFGRAIIQTGAQFETMGIQLRAVTGSVEDANRAMDWITQFTADTPYQLEQVTGAFVKMRAMGLDPMGGAMQAVADMTSYLGGSMDVMNSIVLALGKSWTVGKMSMEEMRMLMERGVPVIDILAE
jgi:phage tail tape-measure protein